jgi:hypothetical protein
VRFAYADPPYPGKAKKHYADHADYAGEVDHPHLIARLIAEYPDGWALSTNSGELRWLLPLVPERHRVLAWVKPFAMIKKNVDPTYAWEPVILCGGRNRFGERNSMMRDWIAVMPPIFRKKTNDPTIGEKPIEFCYWLFDCFGCMPDDEFVDLFPGSGAVARAWRAWSGREPEKPYEQAAMAI